MSYTNHDSYYSERGGTGFHQPYYDGAVDDGGPRSADGPPHHFHYDQGEVHHQGSDEIVENAVYLSARGSEQSAFLPMAREMRDEACFCDVTFIVQGHIFKAHRIIVSAWSRWLRALLSDEVGGGGEEEKSTAMPLDQFEPDAFGAVLDYMYGGELRLSVENSDRILKVIRRLELRQLEQECWKTFLAVLDRSNCKKLHELADRFDCPPLKLAAWHILRETSDGYAANPSSHLLHQMADGDVVNLAPPTMAAYLLKGSGLTGPGEFAGGDVAAENAHPNILDTGSEEGDRPAHLSVFADYSHQYGHEGGSVYSSELSESHMLLPEQLPPGAPAASVIKAWAYKLQLLYELCSPRGHYEDAGNRGGSGGDYDEGGYYHQSEGQNDYNDARYGEIDASNENLASQSDIRNRLISFYNERGLVDRVPYVDNALATFRGRENEMFEMLRDKYDAPESPDYVPASARRTQSANAKPRDQHLYRKSNYGGPHASEARYGDAALNGGGAGGGGMEVQRQESSASQDTKRKSVLQMFRIGS